MKTTHKDFSEIYWNDVDFSSGDHWTWGETDKGKYFISYFAEDGNEVVFLFPDKLNHIINQSKEYSKNALRNEIKFLLRIES